MISQLIDQEMSTSAFFGVLGWKPINLIKITFLIKMFDMNLNIRLHDSTIIFTF